MLLIELQFKMKCFWLKCSQCATPKKPITLWREPLHLNTWMGGRLKLLTFSYSIFILLDAGPGNTEGSPVINVSLVNQYIQLFLDTVCVPPSTDRCLLSGSRDTMISAALFDCGTAKVNTGFGLIFSSSCLCCGLVKYELMRKSPLTFPPALSSSSHSWVKTTSQLLWLNILD